MPCPDLFLQQEESYRLSVLPQNTRRVVIEAARLRDWQRVAGNESLFLGIERFGASAPAKVLAEKFGFTGKAIAERVLSFLGAA